VRLTFTGRYVLPYFREEERPAVIHAAAALAERVGATHGGLYARCEHSSSHQLGAWFLGPGPRGAAASLVYFMGVKAEVPQVRAELSAGSRALDRLGQAFEPFDRPRVGKLVGTHGGMIAGRAEGPGSITFPFRDGNRAARASLELVRAAKLEREP
jgi:hypothetical protein